MRRRSLIQCPLVWLSQVWRQPNTVGVYICRHAVYGFGFDISDGLLHGQRHLSLLCCFCWRSYRSSHVRWLTVIIHSCTISWFTTWFIITVWLATWHCDYNLLFMYYLLDNANKVAFPFHSFFARNRNRNRNGHCSHCGIFTLFSSLRKFVMWLFFF